MSHLVEYEIFFRALKFPTSISVEDNLNNTETLQWESHQMAEYLSRDDVTVLKYDRERPYGKHAIKYLDDDFMQGHNFATGGTKGFAIYTFGELKISTNILNFNDSTARVILYQNDFFFWIQDKNNLVSGITTQHSKIDEAKQPHNFMLDLTFKDSITFNQRKNYKSSNLLTQIYVSPYISDNPHKNFRSLSVFETLKNLYVYRFPLTY